LICDGDLELFRWRWPAFPRLKVPLGRALHRFFAPEWDFSFGNWLTAEVLNGDGLASDANMQLLAAATDDRFSWKNISGTESPDKE